MFKPTVKKEAEVKKAAAPDGQVMPDGSVRYKILCDGGVNPSGVFWTKVVPPGGDYLAAQAERDAKLGELRDLMGEAPPMVVQGEA